MGLDGVVSGSDEGGIERGTEKGAAREKGRIARMSVLGRCIVDV